MAKNNGRSLMVLAVLAILALIFFNIGVELGQLMFVATVVLIALALQRLKHPDILQKVETVVVYCIGTLSSFWVFERISAF